MQHSPLASLGLIKFPDADADPESGQTGEDETADSNEPTRMIPSALVRINAEQRPSNCNSAGEISFGAGKRVCGSGTLEHEECEEDEDFGPYARGVV